VKKLLICDVEGTIFTAIKIEGMDYASSMWQPLAYCLGDAGVAREVALANKWERGEFETYIEWVYESFLFHKELGLKQSDFDRILNEVTYMPGVIDFFKNLDRSKYLPVLISGGFQELVDRAKEKLGIKHGHGACAYVFDEQTGVLKDCRIAACDFDGKIDYMRCTLREYNLDEDTDWIFIGDGKNDVPIAEKAPISFAINGHEKLLQIVTYPKDALGVTITNFGQIGEIISRLSDSDFEKKWKEQQVRSVSENEIVAQMSVYLFGITKLLLSWLGGILPKIRKNWWDEYIRQAKIPFPEAYEKAYNNYDLSFFDLLALIHIVKSIWNRIKNSIHIKGHQDKIRSIRDLHRVRNDWGHIPPGRFPKKDKILKDLRTLEKFIQLFNEDDLADYKSLAADIKQFRMSLDA